MTAGWSNGGSPFTSTRPRLGRSIPHTSLSSVLLPAPLGPRRPVTPGPRSTVTSFRPSTSPYHLLTRSIFTLEAAKAAVGVIPSPPRCGPGATRARTRLQRAAPRARRPPSGRGGTAREGGGGPPTRGGPSAPAGPPP